MAYCSRSQSRRQTFTSQLSAFVVAVSSMALTTAAWAEGSSEVGSNQGLRQSTQLFVDILNHNTETFVWEGWGDVDVYYEVSPWEEEDLGSYEPGDVINPDENGTYRIEMSQDQFVRSVPNGSGLDSVADWAVTVYRGGSAVQGRLWAYAWGFDAGTFLVDGSTTASFFAIVPGGSDDHQGVIELHLEGLAGYVFFVAGSPAGVLVDPIPNGEWDGGNHPGVSIPDPCDYSVDPTVCTEDVWFVDWYPLYLNPPDSGLASYSSIRPEVSDFAWSGGPNGCSAIAPGEGEGTFTFNTTVEGTYHIVCDLNDDGFFNIIDIDDLHLIGPTREGENSRDWDGYDNAGNPVPPGEYECRVQVSVGEFHFTGQDVETSYPGMRMFEVDQNRTDRTGLNMLWNDSLVQDRAVEMPSYGYGMETSGPMGVDSDDYDDVTYPYATGRTNGNGRAWGDFSGSNSDEPPHGKGDRSYLDTYTWLQSAVSDIIDITVFGQGDDTDGEGLTDYTEECITGTNWQAADSDGDSVNDYVETNGGTPNRDTDEDGVDNAWDTDDDDDGILTIDEDPNGDNDPTNDDTDGDNLDNYLDPDDDGDGLDTVEEDLNGDGNYNNDDTDGDGTPNYLDDDDDGDLVDTADEDLNGDGNYMNDDTDGDNTPDYLDDDDDGDLVDTDDEDVDGNGDPMNDDTDGDGTADYLDDDDDGDSVDTEDEDVNGNGNPMDDDTDDDDIPDYLDDDDDGDGIDTDDEDVNGDGDPTNDDTDGDGTPNYLDPDDNDGPLGDADGDDILNQDDNCDYDPNPLQEDIDNDGLGDVCDPDMDGDDILNDDDNCPRDSNRDQNDQDNDGLGDVCDPDIDGDDILNDDDNCVYVHNPGQEDANNNGVGDACEDDIDGDGILNDDDNCPEHPNPGQEDMDGDGIGDVCDTDADGDDVDNDDDNCPFVDNPGQEDLDNDGIGDACDTDADGDGVVAGEDCDDMNPNAFEGGTYYNDSEGDGYGDPNDSVTECGEAPDGYVEDNTDNCPTVANPDQADQDGDGFGDACDDCVDEAGPSWGCPDIRVGSTGCSCSTTAEGNRQSLAASLLLLTILLPLWARARK